MFCVMCIYIVYIHTFVWVVLVYTYRRGASACCLFFLFGQCEKPQGVGQVTVGSPAFFVCIPQRLINLDIREHARKREEYGIKIIV